MLWITRPEAAEPRSHGDNCENWLLATSFQRTATESNTQGPALGPDEKSTLWVETAVLAVRRAIVYTFAQEKGLQAIVIFQSRNEFLL